LLQQAILPFKLEQTDEMITPRSWGSIPSMCLAWHDGQKPRVLQENVKAGLIREPEVEES
jgi:hypothetical protein